MITWSVAFFSRSRAESTDIQSESNKRDSGLVSSVRLHGGFFNSHKSKARCATVEEWNLHRLENMFSLSGFSRFSGCCRHTLMIRYLIEDSDQVQQTPDLSSKRKSRKSRANLCSTERSFIDCRCVYLLRVIVIEMKITNWQFLSTMNYEIFIYFIVHCHTQFQCAITIAASVSLRKLERNLFKTQEMLIIGQQSSCPGQSIGEKYFFFFLFLRSTHERSLSYKFCCASLHSTLNFVTLLIYLRSFNFFFVLPSTFWLPMINHSYL